MADEQETLKPTSTPADYRKVLSDFDGAVCEAIAVSQAAAQRMELPAVGYSTHVFARICAHARSMICAAPQSRWVRREFETWDVSSVAGYARSILEGYILFRYLADAPNDLDVQRAYVQVMHLYDCKKRISILPYVLNEDSIDWFKSQEQEIADRLKGIQYFNDLDAGIRNAILKGERLHIPSRADLVEAAGIEKKAFDFFYNYLSQYAHVFSFTFHRIEENGRGTGMENAFDRDALVMVLSFASGILTSATDKMVELFPDAKDQRLGTNSKFSPGPTKNLPKQIKRERNIKRWS